MAKIAKVLKGVVTEAIKFTGNYITKENLSDAKKEISRLSSIANKRLQRLENSDLQNSPSFKKWFDEGAVKFGVKGKNHNELQKELSRLNKFLDSETSTIRGLNNVLKDMAKNTGIKYKNMSDLRKKSDKFFELHSKVEQYLREVEDIASAIGYQKIWETINQYVKETKTDLAESEKDIEDLVSNITEILTADNHTDDSVPYDISNDGWWFV